MPVRRPKSGNKRDTSKVDELINHAGDDPEIQTVATPKSSEIVSKPVGKNRDPRYRKQLLYLPVELADKLKREAFESTDQDMSDIVAELLAQRYSEDI